MSVCVCVCVCVWGGVCFCEHVLTLIHAYTRTCTHACKHACVHEFPCMLALVLVAEDYQRFKGVRAAACTPGSRRVRGEGRGLVCRPFTARTAGSNTPESPYQQQKGVAGSGGMDHTLVEDRKWRWRYEIRCDRDEAEVCCLLREGGRGGVMEVVTLWIWIYPQS